LTLVIAPKREKRKKPRVDWRVDAISATYLDIIPPIDAESLENV
jgi:hypothetical protein